MEKGKKIYFASDVHLGAPAIKDPLTHEKRFVSWLDSIKDSAHELYLMGDIFDFWFEYKRAIPKGFTRFLGKLCEFTDNSIPVHFFTGNHDIWIFDYLPKETGIIVHRKPVIKTIDNRTFYLAHGDGLGPYDKSYNFLKKIFTSKINQWLFARLHPNFGIGIASSWSMSRRTEDRVSETATYLGDDKEWLVRYSKDVLKIQHCDFFVYGHRHIAKEINIADNVKFIYLGDWINLFTYGVWDGSQFELKKYKI